MFRAREGERRKTQRLDITRPVVHCFPGPRAQCGVTFSAQSISGATSLHGPHQLAQKSTSTGWPALACRPDQVTTNEVANASVVVDCRRLSSHMRATARPESDDNVHASHLQYFIIE